MNLCAQNDLVIHRENRISREWVFTGLLEFYRDKMDNISFSVILAFFINKLYELIINLQENNQYTFQYFNKIIRYLKKLIDEKIKNSF